MGLDIRDAEDQNRRHQRDRVIFRGRADALPDVFDRPGNAQMDAGTKPPWGGLSFLQFSSNVPRKKFGFLPIDAFKFIPENSRPFRVIKATQKCSGDRGRAFAQSKEDCRPSKKKEHAGRFGNRGHPCHILPGSTYANGVQLARARPIKPDQ